MEISAPLPLQQDPRFGATLARLGAAVDMLDLPGAAPVLRLRRFGVNFVSRGPIWIGDSDRAAALRAAPIRLLNDDNTGATTLRRAGFRQIMTPAHVAELSLTGTPADRLAAMHGKWRNIWRKAQKAQKAQLRIEQDRFDPVKHRWLLSEDLAQQQIKRFRALPQALLLVHAAQNPSDVIVLTAHIRRDPVAAMLFILHAPVATYHIGWAGPVGRTHAAHYALLTAAADHLADRGFTRLDLGMVDTENAPGLARFKIGSGAVIRPLGGTWLRLPFL